MGRKVLKPIRRASESRHPLDIHTRDIINGICALALRKPDTHIENDAVSPSQIFDCNCDSLN